MSPASCEATGCWLNSHLTVSRIISQLQAKVISLSQLQVFEHYIQQDLSLIELLKGGEIKGDTLSLCLRMTA